MKLKTRYGFLDVPLPKTDLIGRFLMKYGEWGWDEAVFAASLIPDGARILDAGAFLGTFGLGLMRKRRISFACFLEANADLVPSLERNVARNTRSDFAVCNAILIGQRGANAIGNMHQGNLGSLSFVPIADNLVSKTGIQLEELRNRFGPFDLIKLDIEGLEIDVLRSDIDWIANGESRILVECNEVPASLELGALLLATGRPLHYFAFPSFNPRNYRGSKVPIFPFAYEAALIVSSGEAPKLSLSLERKGCLLRKIDTVDDLKVAMWQTPRWGKAEWRGKWSPIDTALAARMYLSQNFDDFLSVD